MADDFLPADENRQDEALLMAERFRNIFETHRDGQVVLEYLQRRFALNSGAVLTGGIDGVTQTFYRSGQRSVIDHILLQINRANGAE